MGLFGSGTTDPKADKFAGGVLEKQGGSGDDFQETPPEDAGMQGQEPGDGAGEFGFGMEPGFPGMNGMPPPAGEQEETGDQDDAGQGDFADQSEESGGYNPFAQQPAPEESELAPNPTFGQAPAGPVVNGPFKMDAQLFHGGQGPCFTKVEPEEDYAGEFSLTMPQERYIGETSMLLEYVQRLEAKHHISMPIKACGLDPILFENASKGSEDSPNDSFVIMDGDKPRQYELVYVDGELYVSCLSASLDLEYLRSVIREATVEMAEHGSYTYHMVGFRVLAHEDGAEVDSLLRTLRLNSYEMSVLCSYMESAGATYEFGECEGRECIRFLAKS